MLVEWFVVFVFIQMICMKLNVVFVYVCKNERVLLNDVHVSHTVVPSVVSMFIWFSSRTSS